jgi:hypothetical protein
VVDRENGRPVFLEALKKELEQPGQSVFALKEIGIDLGIAERSLTHFQKAYELELKLSRAAARDKN